ncbi:MAG: cytochrome c [Deltaproteobacteria bacterium]|nr:cytochrome c [Deltaproteobacteria bacterium]
MSRNLLFVSIALTIAGCDVRSIRVADLDTAELLIDAPVSGAADEVVPLGGYRALVRSGNELFLYDEGLPDLTVVDVGDYALVGGATLRGDVPVVVTGTDVRVWTGEGLATSAVSELLGGPPTSVRDRGGELWLQTPAELHRVADGRVDRIRFGDQPVDKAFALGATPDGKTVLWARHKAGVLGMLIEGWETVDHRTGLPADMLAADSEGNLWALAGSALWWRSVEGAWARFDVDEPVLAVSADPGAPGAWVQTESSLLHARGETLIDTGRSYSGVLRVDDLGRLLVPTASGVERLALDRGVAVRGVQHGERLANAVTIELFPSRLGVVTDLTATLDGEPVALEDGRFRLELEGLSTLDSHTLSAHAVWDDGGEADSLPLTFSIDPIGNVTWANDIEPLYLEECARCHDGDTDTRLDTPALWEEQIDDVLFNVRSGAMPIGDPLNDAQIAAIEAWWLGGFQP